MSVTHAVPRDGDGVTPCCDRTPFNLPRGDRLTLHVELVTCPGGRPPERACSFCDGQGLVYGDNGWRTCESCGGSGDITDQRIWP